MKTFSEVNPLDFGNLSGGEVEDLVIESLFDGDQLPEEVYRQLFERYEQFSNVLGHPGGLENPSAIANGLAQNPYTPPDILEELSHTHNESIIARWICANPNASVETLERMSLDPDWLYFMMLNPNIPLSILEKARHHEDKDIRAMAATSPRATLEILTDLSFDGAEEVRQAVYNNPLTPQELKDQMDEDDD